MRSVNNEASSSSGPLVRLLQQQSDAICDTPDASLIGIVAVTRVVTRRLVYRALLVRICMLLAMAVSCHFVPDDLAPVDDSLVSFDLRSDSDCFALQASFYHCNYQENRVCGWNETSTACYQEKTTWQKQNLLQRRIYPFLLEPLTRWDAARFLHLAHTQRLYTPQLLPNSKYHELPNKETLFAVSEQAHAFMPTFPIAIRTTAWWLLRLVRPKFLPATCEQILVLAAWLLNTICFLMATYCMFHMTFNLLDMHQVDAKKSDDDTMPDETRHPAKALRCATQVTLLFLINPANVFFGSAYSESLFCYFVFMGSLLRGDLLFITEFILWFMAAQIRSNGVLYFGYLLLHGFIRVICSKERSLVGGLICISAGFVIQWRTTLGVHNLQGIVNHCYDSGGRWEWTFPSPDAIAPIRPDWCDLAIAQGSMVPFDLYSYVQRKHWNVGFLRYFTAKQIPNFLLAAPIIIIALFGVGTWIRASWTRYHGRQSANAGVREGLVRRFIRWALHSLQAFASPEQWHDTHCFSSCENVLISSPQLLGDYAVLCVATLLGLFVAHVQVTTRLLCSTCPALYWYMTVLVSPRRGKPRWVGEAVLGYCLLYNLLGVIMHPNWLPWT